MSVTVGLGAQHRVRRSFRPRSVRVSSVVFAVAWILAMVAFVLVTMQLPQGTGPQEATEPGTAQAG